MIGGLSPMVLVLIGGYVLAGLVVGILLHREGHGPETVAGAFLAWPLFVPALASVASPPPLGGGPMATEIDAAISGLRDALDASTTDLDADVDALHQALHAADARLAIVARLIEDTDASDPAVADGLASLAEARDGASAAIRDVLSETAQLRLQIGLHALGDNGLALAPKLRSLVSRARSLKGAEDQWS